MTDTIADRCEREVVDLHEFLEGWLSGRLPHEEGTFGRIRRALAGEFEITSPSGETRDRGAILSDVEAGHGSQGEGFEIRIRNLRRRFTLDEACLVTYEEHQRADPGSEWTRRYSTAAFREAPGTPNGVEWIHLHETWLPDGRPGD